MLDALSLILAANDDTEYDGKYQKLALALLVFGPPADEGHGVRVDYKGYRIRLYGDYESKECTNVQYKEKSETTWATRCVKTIDLQVELRKLKREIDSGNKVQATVEPNNELTMHRVKSLCQHAKLVLNDGDKDFGHGPVRCLKAGLTRSNSEFKLWVYHNTDGQLTWAFGNSEEIRLESFDQARKVVQVCAGLMRRQISDIETAVALLNRVYGQRLGVDRRGLIFEKTHQAQAGDYGLLPVPGKPGHYNETGDSREPGLQVVETPSGVDVSVNGKPAGKLSGNMAAIRKALEAKKVGPTTKNEGGIADTQVLATVEPSNTKVTRAEVEAVLKRGLHGLNPKIEFSVDYVEASVHGYAVHVGLLSGLHSVSIYQGRNNLKNSRFRVDDRTGLLAGIKKYCAELKKLVS